MRLANLQRLGERVLRIASPKHNDTLVTHVLPRPSSGIDQANHQQPGAKEIHRTPSTENLADEPFDQLTGVSRMSASGTALDSAASSNHASSNTIRRLLGSGFFIAWFAVKAMIASAMAARPSQRGL